MGTGGISLSNAVASVAQKKSMGFIIIFPMNITMLRHIFGHALLWGEAAKKTSEIGDGKNRICCGKTSPFFLLVPWWPRDFPSFSMVYRLNAQSLKSHEATRIWNESPLHNLYFQTLEPFGSQTIAQNMGAWRTSLVDLRFATRICIIKVWTPWRWEGIKPNHQQSMMRQSIMTI